MLFIASFFSGFSALIFQILASRQFALIFGNTTEAGSIVVGTFLLGLGLGAWISGKQADKIFLKNPKKILILFSVAELAVGIFTILIVNYFERLEIFSSFITQYSTGSGHISEATITFLLIRSLICITVILPVAMIMGTTLPLALRFLQNKKDQSVGNSVGLLYGFNTLGAAVGCLASDSLLIPNFGLVDTQLFASAASATAAMLAAFLASKNKQFSYEEKSKDFNRMLQLQSYVFSFVMGSVVMTLEILWFKFANASLGQRRIILSLILSCVLFCMYLGSISAVALLKRVQNRKNILIVLLGLIATVGSGSIVFYSHGFFSTFNETLRWAPDSAFEVIVYFWPILKLVGLASFLIGLSFPVLISYRNDRHLSTANATGALLLISAIGSFITSLLLIFFILPAYGIKGGLMFSSLLCWFAGILFFEKRALNIAIQVIVAAFIFKIFATEEIQYQLNALKIETLRPPFTKAKILSVKEGNHDISAVMEFPIGYLGRSEVSRGLMSNGVVISSTAKNDQRYMRAFAHVPLLMHPNPKSALVICYGIGTTAHAVSLYSTIKNIDIADISKTVIELSGFFEKSNRGVLRDSRVNVFINDGRQHLRMSTPEKYDMITVEPPPLDRAGVESLYTEEFNRLVYKSLNNGGFFSQWLPIWNLDSARTKSLIKAFTDVFNESILIEADYGQYILIGRKGAGLNFSQQDFLKKLQDNPEVKNDLQQVDLASTVEFFGMFVSDSKTLSKATDDVLPLNELRPQLEYTPIYTMNSRVPSEIFAENQIGNWCPDCVSENNYELLQYLKVMGTIRRNEKYLKISFNINRKKQSVDKALLSDDLKQSFEKYPYLNRIWNIYFN